MRGVFLDTNIFLRQFLNDDPIKAAATRELFRSIEQGVSGGWTTALVISEIVFILSNPKTYAVDRATIRELILPVLGLPNLRIERKRLYPRVFELYVSYPIDYVDAYHVALLEHYGQTELFSFDTDFDRLPEVTRREP
jgi:predicted nucleic acid-binding protein